MQILSSITEALGPIASSALGHALIGLMILVIGLIVVKLVTGIFGRVLEKVELLKKYDLKKPLVTLTKAILTLFVLIAVLQHFGLTNVLEPIQNLANQFLATVPRIIGASVIAYAGYIIAKILSDIVAMMLGKLDQQIMEKTQNDSVKISPVGSAFVFAAVLLPIIVAALGVLNIPSISVPASDMINQLMSALPKVIGALIILLVTFMVTRFAVFILSSILEGFQFDSLPQRMGVQNAWSGKLSLTKLAGGIIMFFAMLTASVAAVNILEIDMVSHIFSEILSFGSGILVGTVILIVGSFLATMAYQKLSASSNAGIANIARIAIFGLVLAMGLRSMGLAENIVNMAFGLTLGAVAVAVAIAFGLGGKTGAQMLAEHWAKKVIGREKTTNK